jgi:restriction system protein
VNRYGTQDKIFPTSSGRSRERCLTARRPAASCALLVHRVERQPHAPPSAAQSFAGPIASTGVIEPPVQPTVTLLLQTVIVPGEKTSEGTIIQAVALPWFEIIEHLKGDWNTAYQLSPEKWEEMIAGAYKRAGFNPVTLTPRSGDHGRDVIAIKKGLGVGRVIDQVKRYKPPRLVDANDVRALMGVLHTDGASKGFLTTTSDFAPGIRSDPLISPLIPSRLELINGDQLLRRLEELADRPPPPRGRRTAR